MEKMGITTKVNKKIIELKDYSKINNEDKNICESIQNSIYEGKYSIITINADTTERPLRVFGNFNGKYRTHQYIGVLECEGGTVKIGSRFDEHKDQFFLNYILTQTFDISGKIFEDMKVSTKSDRIWDLLLIVVYINRLQQAVKKGLLRQYKQFHYNDSKVRGKIDFTRHIKENIILDGNIMSNGKIAYQTREYTLDNPINQLILLTYQYIKKKEPKLLHNLIQQKEWAREGIRQLSAEIGSVDAKQLRKILRQSNRKIVHSVYKDYEPLRQVCNLILNRMGVNIFNEQKDTVCGMIIDISKLWEKFLYKKIFSPLIGDKGEYKQESYPILGLNSNQEAYRRIKPDFYKESNTWVFEAKYKPSWGKTLIEEINREEAKKEKAWKETIREDIFQVFAYMLALDCKIGGVIFPVNEQCLPQKLIDGENLNKLKEWYEKEKEVQVSKRCADRQFIRIPYIIPTQNGRSYQEFIELMNNIEYIIRENLKNIILKMSTNKKEGGEVEVDEQKLKKLKKQLGVSDIGAKILLSKGIGTKEEVEAFLKMQKGPIEWNNTIKDTDRAAKMIWDSIKNQEEILIYGDYDCDGITATVIAVKLLRAIGGKVHYHINDRVKEGYGMSLSAIQNILDKQPNLKLVITVDNGITCKDQVRYLVNRGIKVIVTDHHEVINEMPEADAIVNPKRKDDAFPFKELCGAGVIWRLIAYLYHTYEGDIELLESTVELVALATVADMVKLDKENRCFVTKGLEKMNKKPSYFFQELRKSMKLEGEVTEVTIGFSYGPLINAVSRLEGDVNELVEVFLSEDKGWIDKKVQEYKENNEKRKELTKQQMESVLDQIEEKHPAIVVYKEELKEGIIGLIAQKIKDRYNCPTVVFTKGIDGTLKGSIRSVEGFPINHKLECLKDRLLKYGGHSLAGGVSIEERNYERFKEEFIKLAEEDLSEERVDDKYRYIACLTEEEINEQTYNEIRKFAPYGMGFEVPTFKFKEVEVKEIVNNGKFKEEHLKIKSNKRTTIIGWSMKQDYIKRESCKKLELIGTIEKNTYLSATSYQVQVREILGR